MTRDPTNPNPRRASDIDRPTAPADAQTAYPARRGLSLVEVTLSIAIVGGLLASVFTAVGVSAKRGYSTAQRTKAAWLARDLLAEIGSKPCAADGGNLLTLLPISLNAAKVIEDATEGSTRATFDSVYDYANWTSSPPVDISGDPLPGFDGWTRAVIVEPVNPQTLARRTNNDAAARITVLAAGPNGERVTASIIRTAATDTLRNPEAAAEDGGVIKGVVDSVGSILSGK